MGQQSFVGSGGWFRIAATGRKLLEIAVVGNIPFVDGGPACLVVVKTEVEFVITTVLTAGRCNIFCGAGSG